MRGLLLPLAIASVLASGCAPAQVIVRQRGQDERLRGESMPPDARPLALAACVDSDYDGSFWSGLKAKTLTATVDFLGPVFHQVGLCRSGMSADLRIDVELNFGDWTITSARTGERLLFLGWDHPSFSPGDVLQRRRGELYKRFSPGGPFYDQLVRERSLPARPAPAAPSAAALVTHASAAAPTPAFSSDIETPSYRLPERARDFAVVVGIESYSDLPPARFAQRDAQAVVVHLLAMGLPSRNVVQLQGEKAGFKGIEKYLEAWLPNNVADSSRVFFYFSGHGAPDPKTGDAYLLPWDGDPNYLERTGYPVKRLYEELASLKAKEVIVAMDACFSGAGGRSVLAKGARPLVTKVETLAVPRNLTVFAAASGDQITSTLEDQGHGTFTYYFLKGWSGGAKDASGRVTTKALYDYLKPKVQDAARRQNRDQEPVLHGSRDRELIRF
jgi:hypothetical protein